MLPALLVTLAPASAEEAAAVALAPDASTCMLLAEPPDGGGGDGAAAARPALQAGTLHRQKSSALEKVAALDNLHDVHDVVLVHMHMMWCLCTTLLGLVEGRNPACQALSVTALATTTPSPGFANNC
jgi:hypothetical protein